MSALNCKQGDLAVIVHSYAGQEGFLVTVDHFAGVQRFSDGGVLSDVWACKSVGRPLRGEEAHGYGYLGDHQLKPIRDPGEDDRDETLTWLPVPSTTKEVA